jgi:hypothetical protein
MWRRLFDFAIRNRRVASRLAPAARDRLVAATFERLGGREI